MAPAIATATATATAISTIPFGPGVDDNNHN